MSEENNNQTPYTFWAEQVTSNQNTDTGNQNNPQTNPYNMNNYYSYQQPFPPNKPKEKKHRAGKFFSFFAKAVAFGAIASAVFIGCNSIFSYYLDDEGTKRPYFGNGSQQSSSQLNVDPPGKGTTAIPSTNISENVNIQSTDVSQVIDEVMPATVAITSTFNNSYSLWGYQYGGEQTGGGSGIIIAKNEDQLFIATNNHVVEDAIKLEITFIDGSIAEAVIRGRNAAADLAVITVDLSTLSKETLDTIKVAKLGSSDHVKVGQMAIAIGNALGYGQSVTVGYISAKDREIAVDSNTTLTVLQTDAAINPGNSGGALINIDGEVIGINSAKLSSTQVEGMGYAIPISTAYPIVDELMNREVLADDDKGYLGVYITDVDNQMAEAYGWPIGIYVKQLIEDGAAQKAGILVGDIITGVNSITVTNAVQLQDTITAYRHGTTVTVTLMRFVNGEYKEMKLDVTLQKQTQ